MEKRLTQQEKLKVLIRINRLMLIEDFLDSSNMLWFVSMVIGWGALFMAMIIYLFLGIPTPWLSGFCFGVFLISLIFILYKSALVKRWSNDTD